MNKNKTGDELEKTARLKGMVAHTVAFVKSPANKRKFALLKSANKVLNIGSINSNSSNNKEKGMQTMNTPIISQFTALLPRAESFEEIEKSLRASEDFEVSDDDITTLKSLFKASRPSDQNSRETQETSKGAPAIEQDQNNQQFQTLQKENETLQKRLAKIEKKDQIREHKDWLQKNAPYANVNDDETAEVLYEMQKSSSPGIEQFKASLVKTSASNERSEVFNNIGHSRPGNVGDSRQLVFKCVEDNLNVIEKSANAPKNELDRLNVALSSITKEQYKSYVNSFLLRSAI